MRLQILKLFPLLLITIFFLGSLVTTLIWYIFDSHVASPRQPPHKKSAPQSPEPCKNCRDVANVVKRYAEPWKKQAANQEKFSALLSIKCHGAESAIVTRNNTPLGSQIVYSGEAKRSIQVTPDLFHTFPQEHPFSRKKWKTCSVVGNGGILINSTCGKQIDSAQFVIRCNLPPLEHQMTKDVGNKTNLVTANPSILVKKFSGLNNYRRPFVDSLKRFGDSLLVMPTFSFRYNTGASLRAVYAIEDLNSPIRPVALNPKYLQSLHAYWLAQGLKELRLSTGFIMVSLALEVCGSVDLYGFWPFGVHPHDLHPLTNHYYDNKPPQKRFHAMPSEFDRLLKLHSSGVLRIHLGECEAARGGAPTAS